MTEQRTLIIADSRDRLVPGILRRLGFSLRYAKLAVASYDLSYNEDLPALTEFSSVLLVRYTRESNRSDVINAIADYATGGGGVVVVAPGDDPELLNLCGIDSSGTFANQPIECSESVSIQIDNGLFPGLADLHVSAARQIEPYRYTLSDEAPVECFARYTFPSEEIPMLWKIPVGTGQLIALNANILVARHWRALIVQSLLAAQARAVQWIANAAMIQIDDFPSGAADLRQEPVASELDKSALPFYEEYWLPDMLELADQMNLAYSFATPFNYNETCSPPFTFEEWEANSRTYQGTEIPFGAWCAHNSGAGNELGMHGYNHVPLTIENWGNKEAMVLALEAALARWHEDRLGEPPTSYVPPMNMYDRVGAEALSEADPDLTVICGNWWGDRSLGMGREFEVEPWNSKLFCMPRVTSGYNMSEKNQLFMASVLAESGIWTHFLHADDIYDTPENEGHGGPYRNPDNAGWRGNHSGSLRDQLRDWFRFAKDTYPWLEFLTASAAADRVKQHLANDVHVRFLDDAVELESKTDAFCQLRVTHGTRVLESGSDVRILHTDKLLAHTLVTLAIPAGCSRIGLS